MSGIGIGWTSGSTERITLKQRFGILSVQRTGAFQYLKYRTPYLTVTWQLKAPSYNTPVLMAFFRRPHLRWALRVTESAGFQLNYLPVQVHAESFPLILSIPSRCIVTNRKTYRILLQLKDVYDIITQSTNVLTLWGPRAHKCALF